jgi:hypothetical protein
LKWKGDTLSKDQIIILDDFFKSQIKEFSFQNKKVAFYERILGFQSKEDFFKDMGPHLKPNESCPIQIIILDEKEKSSVSEVDIILVTWSIFEITPKYRKSIIYQLEKMQASNAYPRYKPKHN